MNRPLLETRRLAIGYHGAPLLPPLDLQVRPGEFWAVVGRNGSGKTTLFRTLLGLQAPLHGEVVRAAGYLPAYVPQRAALDAIVPLRVKEVVALGAERGWSFVRGRAVRHGHAVAAALEKVGILDLAVRQFHELSEGQKQKVLLARVLAASANVAFLDEPTAAMDAVAERESLEAIDALRKEHELAVVIVSHFLGVARRVADKVLFLDRELQTAVTGTPREVFTSDSFRRRYGDVEGGA